LRQLQHLDGPGILLDAVFIQVLRAELVKSVFLAFVVEAKIRAEFVLQFQLDKIVRMKIPRLNRILPIIVYSDAGNKLLIRFGDYLAENMN